MRPGFVLTVSALALGCCFSGSVGSSRLPSAEPTVLPGCRCDDYGQIVLTQKLNFAWQHR